MSEYVAIFGVGWRAKDGKVVELPVLFTINVSDVEGVGKSYYVSGLNLGGVVNGDVEDELIVNDAVKDIIRFLRKRLKKSLKGSVYESLRVVPLSVRVVSDNDGEESVKDGVEED